MARIAHDPYLIRGAHRQAGRGPGASLILLMLAAVLLLVLSRLDHPVTRHIRATVTEWVSPAAAWGSSLLGPVRAIAAHFDDVAALRRDLATARAEIARLEAADWRAAEATRKLAEVERLAAMVPALGATYRSARVLTEAVGPFSRSLVIDAGGEHGLRAGHPVVGPAGLVGRVVEVGARAARVLLLTDIASRVPVVIGDGRARAIAIGDNSPRLAIGYADRDAKMTDGDIVATSGVGGSFPAGLRIGRIAIGERDLRIVPFADLDAPEHVSVLIVDPPDAALGTADGAGQRRRGGANGKAG